MNKFLLILFFIGQTLFLLSQGPNAINYQGYLTDVFGNSIINRTVSMEILVSEDTQGASVLYSEAHNVTTNDDGLFNIIIGEGNQLSGNFDAIDWLSGQSFIGVKYDLNDGVGMRMLGYDFIYAVPFALNAKYVINCAPGFPGEAGSEGPQGPQGIQGAQGIQASFGLEGPQGVSGDPIIEMLQVPPPSPTNRTIYLDDGTNRTDGQPGLRYFDGTNWIDL